MNIQKISAKDCYGLRESILRPNQPKENWTFDADDDPRTIHLAMKDGETIIAIVSLLPETHDECPKCPWRLRGMAVVEQFRGKGIGQELLLALLVLVNEGVWCTARNNVRSFYEANGFTKVGDEFVMNNMPHVRMQKSS